MLRCTVANTSWEVISHSGQITTSTGYITGKNNVISNAAQTALNTKLENITGLVTQ